VATGGDPQDVDLLSVQARKIWDDAGATTWGRDNGRSFYAAVAALPDPAERIRLCRLFMDRQHASFRALQQVAYQAWREGLPSGQSPVASGSDYSRLVERGDDFRSSFEESLDGLDSDAERAELLTILVDDGSRWLAELRDLRDEAIMNTLADGHTPRELARRLQLSKTQIINVRHKYLRRLDTVGVQSRHIQYRSSDGVVVHVNQAFEAATGLRSDDVVGRPVGRLTHPDDRAVLMPVRDAAVRRGHGRFRQRLRLTTAAGGWRWVDADFRVITNPDTSAVETHGRARPVPDRVVVGAVVGGVGTD
jgi:PAS domain S-box-containing protein